MYTCSCCYGLVVGPQVSIGVIRGSSSPVNIFGGGKKIKSARKARGGGKGNLTENQLILKQKRYRKASYVFFAPTIDRNKSEIELGATSERTE